MEWCISVNEMLRDVITKVNYTLIPPGFKGDVRRVRVMQDSLARVIDNLGEQSRVAQGLNKVITTADKLIKTPSHVLYLLKDPNALDGKGEVIGMLKVGRKHLFLFDGVGRTVEVEPLCVLDFYVLPQYQRQGHGKTLFQYMLQDTNSKPEELAIDGPSAKMEQFLCKNYGLPGLVRQNNNFAVVPNFFDVTAPTARGRRPVVDDPAPAHGRFAAPKPASAISAVIHGSGGSPAYYEEDGASSSKESGQQEEKEWGRAQSGDVAAAERDSGGERPAGGEPPAAAAGQAAEPEPHPGNGEVELEWDMAVFAERPSSLPVPLDGAGAEAGAERAADTPASRPDSQLTERGYFDIKFYHNKLW